MNTSFLLFKNSRAVNACRLPVHSLSMAHTACCFADWDFGAVLGLADRSNGPRRRRWLWGECNVRDWIPSVINHQRDENAQTFAVSEVQYIHRFPPCRATSAAAPPRRAAPPSELFCLPPARWSWTGVARHGTAYDAILGANLDYFRCRESWSEGVRPGIQMAQIKGSSRHLWNYLGFVFRTLRPLRPPPPLPSS